jgi:hypothetical protein
MKKYQEWRDNTRQRHRHQLCNSGYVRSASHLEGKRKRAATEGVYACVDPEGYRRFIAGKRRAFEDEVDLELGVPKKTTK